MLFGEPAEFTALRAEDGPTRVRTAAGDTGWLVARHRDLRALTADPRIGRSHRTPDAAPRLWHAALFTPQSDPDTELDDHRRWRAALNPRFSPRNLAAARARTERLCGELVDAMVADGPPADLCARLAEPLARHTIFGLLGIPAEDQEQVRAWSDGMRDPQDRANAEAHYRRITGYLADQLARRARDPRDDALSDLARALDRAGPLTPRQTGEAAGHLFFGGYETMSARIAHGMLFLLAHPEQADALRADPGLAPAAVEEVMRLAVPGGSWIPRYALADIDYEGRRIRAGDLVVFAIQSANRDEEVFADSGRFDIRRAPNPHVGFGHGKFYCLGAGLARIQLETVFATVFRRLPGLRLAVSVDALEQQYATKVTGGLAELPVAW